MNNKKITILAVGAVISVTIAVVLILLSLTSETIQEQEPTKIENLVTLKYLNPDDHRGTSHGKPNSEQSACYSFLAKDAKWKEVEPWIFNPSNLRGLDEVFIYDNLNSNIIKWEDSAGFNIVGDGTSTLDLLWADTHNPDGRNEIYFDYISEPGVIAKTIVWGYFSGPPQTRELIEFDMIIDDVKFNWSTTGEAGKMDFESIVTHELGHALGLGHPSDNCTEETMYRYADFGETKKRTLEAGDISGIKELYK